MFLSHFPAAEEGDVSHSGSFFLCLCLGAGLLKCCRSTFVRCLGAGRCPCEKNWIFEGDVDPDQGIFSRLLVCNT